MDYNFMAEQIRQERVSALAQVEEQIHRYRHLKNYLATGEVAGIVLTAAQKNKLVLEAAAIGSAWENTCKEVGLETERPVPTIEGVSPSIERKVNDER